MGGEIKQSVQRSGYGKDVRGIVVRSRQGKGFISAPKCPDRPWAHPAPYSVGVEINYSGVKAAGT